MLINGIYTVNGGAVGYDGPIGPDPEIDRLGAAYRVYRREHKRPMKFRTFVALHTKDAPALPLVKESGWLFRSKVRLNMKNGGKNDNHQKASR